MVVINGVTSFLFFRSNCIHLALARAGMRKRKVPKPRTVAHEDQITTFLLMFLCNEANRIESNLAAFCRVCIRSRLLPIWLRMQYCNLRYVRDIIIVYIIVVGTEDQQSMND